VPAPIEDYALIGDTHAAALVSRGGSIDWLCLPRFDSGACFARLVGTEDNGRWLIAPSAPTGPAKRSYRGNTMVLDTDWTAAGGSVRVTDCMPIRIQRRPFSHGNADVIRIVEGVSGRVKMRVALTVRFDYGRIIPWVRRDEHGDLVFIGGPDALCLRTDIELEPQGLHHVAEFEIEEGEQVAFVLTWYCSHEQPPSPVRAVHALHDTLGSWTAWAGQSTYLGRYRDFVDRSLLTLKALTYAPSGGIVAAPTTSLPEEIGGVRNWDYRFCWLRDAAFTLEALLAAGFADEARAWREWLLRAVAGDPADMQIMYGCTGERRLTEYEVDWLSGYEGSKPVRIGNLAAEQFQLDVYGEVTDLLHRARVHDIPTATETAWPLVVALVDFLEQHWDQPDEGIWEIRGERRHFTYSKVMAWVAIDRAIQAVEQYGLEGDVERWRDLRTQIHEEVCAKGYDQDLGSFTQAYGTTYLDATLLLIPRTGFLPPDDPRVVGTIAAVEERLVEGGFVNRYDSHGAVDGLPGGEGAFLACTCWLADALFMQGRVDEANEVFGRVLDVGNDLGLFAEEYDLKRKRMIGNFPQAFTHVAIVNTAVRLGGSR
jgi:GH15 family glucan-1,4-alpha-glucosidase